jgi:diguanylate cyclase (GGDEF)-like protein
VKHRRPVVRPILLMLVYGAFLVIVGITATAQALIVSQDTWTTVINETVGADTAMVRSFAATELRVADITGPIDEARRKELDAALHVLTEQSGVVRVAIMAPDGRILTSSEPDAAGRLASDPGLQATVSSQNADAAIVAPGEDGSIGPVLTSAQVLREYLPVVANGKVWAIIGLWRDADPIFVRLDSSRTSVVAVTLTGAGIIAIVLFVMFRAAQSRITRQTAELVEATSRDALTGRLNHGAIVETLLGAVEEGRASGDPVAVALVDVDNFRLTNETYGHEAGDQVLFELSRTLSAVVDPGWVCGRYGPDEFLVVARGAAASDLEPAMTRLSTLLMDKAMTFEGSERLPVTVSAGLSFFPANGTSVNEILSVAVVALGEAKASGGDRVCVASTEVAHHSDAPFDVLRGLIIAVDTKDRYTKRHSEDVARYADFLAGLLDLDPELRRAVRTAGLLHDIGKIGIPDGILRKPGRLTEAEYLVVQQHVALGNMIVREVPDLDVVRAGIRHHHERWDGSGYLDRLEGEGIPLIARILAVGDAFSAMTTTRPYRKALPVDEALRRLEDACGTQLDERLALAFVRGIRAAADPPLPGDDRAGEIWMPFQWVA